MQNSDMINTLTAYKDSSKSPESELTPLCVPRNRPLIIKQSRRSVQRAHCFALLGQSIRSLSWLLIGPWPTDTQLLAVHIKGLWGWKKKSQIYWQSLSSNCRNCGERDSSQLFCHHREHHSHTHTCTRTHIHWHTQDTAIHTPSKKHKSHACKQVHTCAHPRGSHYSDWLQDLFG